MLSWLWPLFLYNILYNFTYEILNKIDYHMMTSYMKETGMLVKNLPHIYRLDSSALF